MPVYISRLVTQVLGIFTIISLVEMNISRDVPEGIGALVTSALKNIHYRLGSMNEDSNI